MVTVWIVQSYGQVTQRGQSILVMVIYIVYFCIDNLQYRIFQINCSNNNDLTNLTTFELVHPSTCISDLPSVSYLVVMPESLMFNFGINVDCNGL